MTREELKSEIFKFLLSEAKKNSPNGGSKASAAVLELVAETFEGVRDCFDGFGGASDEFKDGWNNTIEEVRELASLLNPPKRVFPNNMILKEYMLMAMAHEPTIPLTVNEVANLVKKSGYTPSSGNTIRIQMYRLEDEGYVAQTGDCVGKYQLTSSGVTEAKKLRRGYDE